MSNHDLLPADVLRNGLCGLPIGPQLIPALFRMPRLPYSGRAQLLPPHTPAASRWSA